MACFTCRPGGVRAAHRRLVLAEIRTRLDAVGRCRVVATQLIEAGVSLWIVKGLTRLVGRGLQLRARTPLGDRLGDGGLAGGSRTDKVAGIVNDPNDWAMAIEYPSGWPGRPPRHFGRPARGRPERPGGAARDGAVCSGSGTPKPSTAGGRRPPVRQTAPAGAARVAAEGRPRDRPRRDYRRRRAPAARGRCRLHPGAPPEAVIVREDDGGATPEPEPLWPAGARLGRSSTCSWAMPATSSTGGCPRRGTQPDTPDFAARVAARAE
jgi:hypothetical protein